MRCNHLEVAFAVGVETPGHGARGIDQVHLGAGNDRSGWIGHHSTQGWSAGRRRAGGIAGKNSSGRKRYQKQDQKEGTYAHDANLQGNSRVKPTRPAKQAVHSTGVLLIPEAHPWPTGCRRRKNFVFRTMSVSRIDASAVLSAQSDSWFTCGSWVPAASSPVTSFPQFSQDLAPSSSLPLNPQPRPAGCPSGSAARIRRRIPGSRLPRCAPSARPPCCRRP